MGGITTAATATITAATVTTLTTTTGAVTADDLQRGGPSRC